MRAMRVPARVGIAVSVSIITGVLAVSCGERTQLSSGSQASAPMRGADQLGSQSPALPSPSSSDRPCVPPAPPTPLGWKPRSEAERKAHEEVDRYRQELARQLDPEGVNQPNGPREAEPDLGKPVSSEGDVAAYAPRRGSDGSSLIVPVKIVNCGSARAFYKVTITVTGEGFQGSENVETAVTGVYPGTTWPTEVTVRDSRHPAPNHPQVRISVTREE